MGKRPLGCVEQGAYGQEGREFHGGGTNADAPQDFRKHFVCSADLQNSCF